jgi:hypothetical protein
MDRRNFTSEDESPCPTDLWALAPYEDRTMPFRSEQLSNAVSRHRQPWEVMPRDHRRPIIKHDADHLKPGGHTKEIGATPDDTSGTTRHSGGISAETAGLCPYPFPYQIWFDGDAVRARTVRGLYRRGR